MQVNDPYGVLYGFCVVLLLLCLGQALGWPRRVPTRAFLCLLVSLMMVEAYNEWVGGYQPAAQVTSSGYLLLAVIVVWFLLNFVSGAALDLIGVGAMLLLLGAVGLGGYNYGSAWLYDQTHYVMTTNAFLTVLAVALVLLGLVAWRCSRTPLFLWLVDTALLVLTNTLVFNVLLNGSAAFAAHQTSYTVLGLNVWLALDAALGALWFLLPSMGAFAYRRRRRHSHPARDTPASRRHVLRPPCRQSYGRLLG